MSIQDLNIIDIVSINKEGKVILTISDHLEWDLNNEHLLILQNKINIYLGTIENGELYKSYPLAKDKHIVFNVVAMHIPNKEGLVFLKRIEQMLHNVGYGFQFSVQ